MIHLGPADYHRQPWANGRGITTELYRRDENGTLLFRLSLARVSENGPFSLFPGMKRNLTVLTGPGFTLEGSGLRLNARPLSPVAFPGDVPLRATNVTDPSDDFNVMTAGHLPLPKVSVIDGTETVPEGGLVVLFSISPTTVNGTRMRPHDLILTEGTASVSGLAVAARLRLTVSN